MQLQMAIHSHRHGIDYYPFSFADDNHPLIDEGFVLKNVKGIDFEPDRNETLMILDPIKVAIPENVMTITFKHPPIMAAASCLGASLVKLFGHWLLEGSIENGVTGVTTVFPIVGGA